MILAGPLEKHISRYFKGGKRLAKQKFIGEIMKASPNWAEEIINIYL